MENITNRWLYMMIITAISVLAATGYSIAGIFEPSSILPHGADPNKASLIFALYAAARTIPLALISFIVIFKRLDWAILILGILSGTIQLFDSFVGIYQQDAVKSLLPLLIALMQFVGVLLVIRPARVPDEHSNI